MSCFRLLSNIRRTIVRRERLFAANDCSLRMIRVRVRVRVRVSVGVRVWVRVMG